MHLLQDAKKSSVQIKYKYLNANTLHIAKISNIVFEPGGGKEKDLENLNGLPACKAPSADFLPPSTSLLSGFPSHQEPLMRNTG